MYIAIFLVFSSYYSQIKPFKSRIDLNYVVIKKDMQLLGKKQEPSENLYGTLMLINIVDYYNKFDREHRPDITSVKDLKDAPRDEDVYLIRNFYTEFSSRFTDEEILSIVADAGFVIADKPLKLPQYKKCRIFLLTPIEVIN